MHLKDLWVVSPIQASLPTIVSDVHSYNLHYIMHVNDNEKVRKEVRIVVFLHSEHLINMKMSNGMVMIARRTTALLFAYSFVSIKIFLSLFVLNPIFRT